MSAREEAKQLVLEISTSLQPESGIWDEDRDRLLELIDAVAEEARAEERESCRLVAIEVRDRRDYDHSSYMEGFYTAADQISDEIRARGGKGPCDE